MKKILNAVLMTTVLLTFFSSCSPSSDNILDSEEILQNQALYDVSLTFSSSDFTITTRDLSTHDDSTRDLSTRAVTSEIPSHLNRLSLKVFDVDGGVVATLSQKRESLAENETFGSLTLKLPVGDYTFVAVLHELPSDKLSLSPATIISPTEATLPSSRIYDTYCCVQSSTITTAADQSLTLALGTRINAQFRLETLDAVPEEIKSIDMIINPDATNVPSEPSFNPTTGLATGQWKYEVNLTATTGQVFDRSFSVLLPEDSQTTLVELNPINTSNQRVAKYKRILEAVTLQRNHQTHACGYLFGQDITSGFTLDTALAGDISYSF